MKSIITLTQSGKTIFSYADLAHHIEWKTKQDLVNKVHYALGVGYLFRVARGMFSLASSGWNKYELANKILRPSYISLQSALRIHGINFQYEEDIYVVSYKSTDISISTGGTIHFHALKKSIRENFAGVDVRDGFSLASPERAILDTLYLYKTYHFDNLSMIKWDTAQKLLLIYGSKTLEKRFTLLRKNYDTTE